jgi:hypothetical protein
VDIALVFQVLTQGVKFAAHRENTKNDGRNFQIKSGRKLSKNVQKPIQQLTIMRVGDDEMSESKHTADSVESVMGLVRKALDALAFYGECPNIDTRESASEAESQLESAIRALVESRDQAVGQLPDGMKHCTILFKECEKGHGWLTATNWVQHGCPTCDRDALREQVQRLEGENWESREAVLDNAELYSRCPYCNIDYDHTPDCIIIRLTKGTNG